jgi:hypothetical protein
VPVAVPPPADTVDVPQPPKSAGRRRLRPVAVAVVAAAVLLAGGLAGFHRFGPPDSDPTSRAGAPSAQPSPVDALTAILTGSRRFSIQLTEADRYFMLDRGGEELELSDGTGSRSQFVLQSVGVRYMIRSLSNEGYAGPETCLGVSIDPGEEIAPVVSTACNPTKGTLFSLGQTGDKDAKGRPTYRIRNDYGWLLWDADAKRSDVAEVGEPQFADEYSFVDRGEL